MRSLSSTAPSPAYTVLIVESVLTQRELYRRSLLADTTRRYNLLETNSASDALLMCQHHKIDGILLDYTVPDANGLEFMQTLQTQQGQEHPAVVIVASEQDPAIAVRAIKQGAEDYLVKHTLTPHQLQVAIRNAIDHGTQQLEIGRSDKLIHAEAARAEAEAANQSKDEFISLVAHELRSPLNAILGWAKLLQTGQLDTATTQKALEIIVRNTNAQVQLVEELLDASRIARGTMQVNFASVYLLEVVEAALETVRPTVDAKRLQLELFLHQTEPIAGDFNRLQQVVLNLITNAIKFTPEGGRVQILLDQYHSKARLQVKDTGRGIRSDFLPYIFERFSQDEQEAAAKQGLGLGLAIVKSLVEIHNGTVIAESHGEGLGATFTVLLPCSCNTRQQEPSCSPSVCTV